MTAEPDHHSSFALQRGKPDEGTNIEQKSHSDAPFSQFLTGQRRKTIV
jgi:hypothetical protein